MRQFVTVGNCICTNYEITSVILSSQWHGYLTWFETVLTVKLRFPQVRILCCGVKILGNFFTLHFSSSLSCINEYLAIDSGGYVYEQPSRINCSIWLDASQRSRDGV